ncbi:MAG TPA: ABC transporter permease [Magnetospirillaceae bacterium]|jgi:osmoprotectant transport system permease protein
MAVSNGAFVKNPVFLTLGAVALLAAIALPVLSHAPNRLLGGQPLYLSALPNGAAIVLILALAIATGCAFAPQRRDIWIIALVAALIAPIAYVWGTGEAATALAAASAPIARTSTGTAGWVVIITMYLAAAESVRRLSLRAWGRALIVICAIGPIIAMVASGHLDQLALMKEYAVKHDEFAAALRQHAHIVLASFIPALVIGVPLGIVAHRSAKLNGPLLGVLGLIQTIPSIALFGILMAPLSGLARHIPALRDLGISGIGLAPAAIALTLYSLLPIVRNTATGLGEVPAAALDAAAGMGMNRWQILRQIEVPIALPVILSGLRITLVQSIGLAAVAALIGAGGLGSIMFQGLFANAGDLILLGVVPIVGIAVIVDVVFRLIASPPNRGAA